MVHGLRRAGLRVLIAFAAATLAANAVAHDPTGAATRWGGEPWVCALLLLSVALYAAGVWRLWLHAGAGAGITSRDVGEFLAGWCMLAAALCSPLDGLGVRLFTAHMVQHELMMVAAAPLLVLGRPLAAWAWALPSSWRRSVAGWTHAAGVRRCWTAITAPLAAFLIHAAALWVWHVPTLFMAALANRGVHALQHASFLFSALLFWWAICRPSHARLRDGPAVLCLFATMLHTGALGALLTFSREPWYGEGPFAANAWNLTPVADQQLGGLIMWIPAGTVYVLAAVWVMARWIAASGSASASRVPARIRRAGRAA